LNKDDGMNPIDQMHALKKKLDQLDRAARETGSDKDWRDWNTVWNEFGQLYAQHGKAYTRDLKLTLLFHDSTSQ